MSNESFLSIVNDICLGLEHLDLSLGLARTGPLSKRQGRVLQLKPHHGLWLFRSAPKILEPTLKEAWAGGSEAVGEEGEDLADEAQA